MAIKFHLTTTNASKKIKQQQKQKHKIKTQNMYKKNALFEAASNTRRGNQINIIQNSFIRIRLCIIFL